MLVQLIAHTNDPEKTIAAAAKLCYSDAHIETLLDGLTPEKTEAFLQRLNDVGHASPIEHASFTFGIEGVSRTFLAQVTRHRIGGFPLRHPAGDRGHPRGQSPVHCVDERRREEVS